MKRISMLLIFLSTAWNSYAQEYEWIVDNTYNNPGERVVAVIDANPVGSYTGVELIGQVIDNNGNWGYNLPTVANFRMYVKFSGGITYDLVQTVKTSRIKLGLRKISDTKVHLVANCPNSHSAMRVLFKKVEGSLSVIMGDPETVVTSGEILMEQPRYQSELQSTNKLEINNGNNSYGAILAKADESNFQLYTKTLTTQLTNVETFRLGLKYDTNENNGFISFYRGANQAGGFLGFSTNGIERVRIGADGNVGIGSVNPNSNLVVTNNGYAGQSDWAFTVDSKTSDASSAIANFRKANAESVMFIKGNGNIGIGTINPTEKLSVNGTILAKEVRVSTEATDWPDYVFESDYQLRELSEVEAFITENKHLPDIPSAAAMEEQGVNLAEMNKLLLQKVEELTLYMLQQQKEIDDLKTQMNTKTNPIKYN